MSDLPREGRTNHHRCTDWGPSTWARSHTLTDGHGKASEGRDTCNRIVLVERTTEGGCGKRHVPSHRTVIENENESWSPSMGVDSTAPR